MRQPLFSGPEGRMWSVTIALWRANTQVRPTWQLTTKSYLPSTPCRLLSSLGNAEARAYVFPTVNCQLFSTPCSLPSPLGERTRSPVGITFAAL